MCDKVRNMNETVISGQKNSDWKMKKISKADMKNVKAQGKEKLGNGK